MGGNELGNDGSAVGLCFRMNVEAALEGWGAYCLHVVEGKGRKIGLEEGN